ncbi:hypothetical protein [Lelliottia wanjuensis]|uniref:hypothetical protein n=1 Tax=Lelliottia wanjuensis TaxID=3050585 RepID=UPI00254ECD63|nr:hypothetical protein [Lelliottia sp. V86_10]MDK9585416.1 hypothetical protein [Lelliottia sp. V86_10]
MSDTSSEKNNVRVHLSDIPEFFSKALKSFITRQPDFNDDVQERLTQSAKLMEVLNQKIAVMERDAAQNKEELAKLQQTVRRLQGG